MIIIQEGDWWSDIIPEKKNNKFQCFSFSVRHNAQVEIKLLFTACYLEWPYIK